MSIFKETGKIASSVKIGFKDARVGSARLPGLGKAHNVGYQVGAHPFAVAGATGVAGYAGGRRSSHGGIDYK